MITFAMVCRTVPGVSEADLRHWLDSDWVRPERLAGEMVFAEADVARVHLIAELRAELEVEEATVPVVLSLLDQLYAARRHVRLLLEAADGPMRDRIRERLER